MADLNNLDHTDKTLIAESQATKATTSNSLDNLLSDATQKLSSTFTITGNKTLTKDEFFGHLVLTLGGSPGSAFSLFLPATGNHAFFVKNDTGQTVTVDSGASGGTTVDVTTGTVAHLHSDGTSVIALAAAV